MKLIIAGGRDLHPSVDFIATSIRMLDISNITEIVSGNATGVDTQGLKYAINEYIAFKKFPANWSKHGKSAGPIRNEEMAQYADALLLIWNGKSRGSSDMRSRMRRLGKPIYEIVLRRGI